MTCIKPTLTAFLTLGLASVAHAQEAAPAATSPTATATAAPAVAATAGERTPWMKKYRPVRRSWELGIYGGAFIPSARHEFYAADVTVPGFGHQKLARAGADVGLRAGYYPLSFLGVELEAGIIPTSTADDERATLYTIRPVVLAQLPYRIAPFVRAGFGVVGISSGSLGKDIDPSLNLGGGVKFYINHLLALRLDVVDNVATAYGIGNDRSHNLEVLLGLSLRPGKRPPSPSTTSLRDTDGDGLLDPGQVGVPPADEDVCPMEPGPRDNRGCPLRDSDGDTLFDPGQAGVPPENLDACPQQPGPRELRGCPLVDSDGDTLYDPGQPVAATEIDACPKEPGPRELQGCPDRDSDRIVDRIDRCPEAPETRNNYQDDDGCPDAVPQAVTRFTGVIKGIFFDVDRDIIKPASDKTLRKAVKALNDFPTVKVEISGHTDIDGDRDHNLDLSQRRADSVKRYLVNAGIDAVRLTTRGAGPDEPIADNTTTRGKAQNRRIQFKLIE